MAGELTVDPAPAPTITANPQSKTYGSVFVFDGTPDEFTVSGLFNDDQVTSATLTSDGAPGTAPVAGSPYAINIGNAVGFGLENYVSPPIFVAGELTVDPRPRPPSPPTTRARPTAACSSSTAPQTSSPASGLFNDDQVTSATLTSDGAPGTAPVAGSPYLINIGDEASGSKTTSAPRSLWRASPFTLRPRPPSPPTPRARPTAACCFDGTPDEFTVSGLFNDDQVTSATLTSDGAPGTPWWRAARTQSTSAMLWVPGSKTTSAPRSLWRAHLP